MNGFGFYNSLYPGAELTEEQKRYIMGRALLSGGLGMMSRWGQPVRSGPSPATTGINAALQDYDTMAQMALQAQIVKQQNEYKKQKEAEQEVRAERMMDIQESQEKRAQEMHEKRMQQIDQVMKLAKTNKKENKGETAWDIWITKLQPYLAGRASHEDLTVAETGARMGNLNYALELMKGKGKTATALSGMLNIPGIGEIPIQQQEAAPEESKPADLSRTIKAEEVKQEQQKDYIAARRAVDDVNAAYMKSPYGFSHMSRNELEGLYKKLEQAYPTLNDAPWWQAAGYNRRMELLGLKIRERLRQLEEE